jgi:hypothetical protein
MAELALSGDVLPMGVWPFVFPAARTLPHLTCLCVEFELSFDDPALPGAWGAADVARLVSCCPNLRKIDEIGMHHGSHLSQLHKLSAMTEVDLHYGAADAPAFEATMQGLAAVAQLQDLDVNMHCSVVSVAVLLPLTRLTALSRISFTCNVYPEDPDDEIDELNSRCPCIR